MAVQLGPPSPAEHPPPSPTAINAIGDDLLREIFLRLPSLPSLVRAALACRAFLHAVRSSPAFRRRFRALHPLQLLGLFVGYSYHLAIPPFVPLRSRSDPDLAAVLRGSDFLLTRVPQDSGDPGWTIKDIRSGYVLLHSQSTGQVAAYNPVTQALDIIPRPPQGTCQSRYLEFHVLLSEEDQSRPFRMVCVRRRRRRRHTRAQVSVFSSDSREWQGFSWEDIATPQPGDHVKGAKCVLPSYTGMLANEFDRLVYWRHRGQPYIVLLDAATMRLSRLDLPSSYKDMGSTQLQLGRTKDGNDVCMVCTDYSFAGNRVSLAVWFWRAAADHDGVDKLWTLDKIFPLDTCIAAVVSWSLRIKLQIVAFVDGLVYLSIDCGTDYYADCRLASFCLETEALVKVFEDTFSSHIHPYIMAWPPSLVCNKEDPDTKVTGEDVADDGPVGTKETPSVLSSALKSYKEALINGDGAKAADIETLILSIEDEKKSLVRKITTLEAELTNARDCILRTSAEFYAYKRKTVRDAMFALL